MVHAWSLKPRASRNLRRHGNAQITHQYALLAMSFAFWARAVSTTDPVMSPDVYGYWVTSFAAEFWAASIMLACAVYIAGIYINGNWRWSPVLRLFGAGWHVFTMGAFCVGAASVGHDAMMMISATFCGLHIWFTAINFSDLIGSILRWGRE